ncbi:MAG: ABC transporter ATP-binding protein [Acidobacteriota bacterium]|nr:ABC transporter ATP-binding protein [Acidobacteriota bacterium]
MIEVRNLSKQYLIGRQQYHSETLRELISRKLRAPMRMLDGSASAARAQVHEFWALNDVSFDIAEGEVVGVVGGNGAGKSTLLKVLARITNPTRGTIHVRGRIASLLEVGTGFHPELTGRENIFLNGATLGMRKAEIAARFDEIVAFAEVEQFLDTPVKRYSSGMYVRLAFAVAAHLNPEILIVDEVLAVGDMAFQKKCLGKMSEVSHSGRTVLFVSHNMAAVENLCSRGLVLKKGTKVFDGSAKEAVQYYLSSASAGSGTNENVVEFEETQHRKSPLGKLLKRAELYTDGDRPLTEGLTIGAALKIRIHFELPRPTDSFNIGIGFNNLFGQRIFTAHSCFEPERDSDQHSGALVFTCTIPSFTLVPGEYTTFLWLDISNAKADSIEEAMRVSVIESDYYGTGKVPWNGALVLPHHWTLSTD